MSFAEIPWFEVLRLVIDVNVKGALLCVAALLVIVSLRRSSASLRNQIWVGALIALLSLPVLTLVVPERGFSLLPDPRFWGYAAPAPVSDAELEALLAADGFIGPRQPGDLELDVSKPFWVQMSLPHWIVAVWTLGLCVMSGWFLLSALHLKRIMREAVPTDLSWRELLRSLSRVMGLKRDVHLLRSPDIRAGITLGVFRPVVIFPLDAESWPASRRRLVLSHELAHIKRWDSLVEILVCCAMIFYWFNPLVWLAVKRLRIERERDCDNVVLNIGAKPSDYALQLMEIAADFNRSPVPVLQSARISQGSNLKDRLLYILDPTVSRRDGGLRSRLATLAAMLLLVVPLSALGFWRPADELKTLAAGESAVSERPAEGSAQSVKKEWKGGDDSAARIVGDRILAEGLDAGLATFGKLRAAPRGTWYFGEEEFNRLGYDLMKKDMIDEAVAVFKINVKLFPDAWNVYDSLGEAYVHKDEYELASRFYGKSIALGSKVEKQARMIMRRLELAMEEKSGGWSAEKIIRGDEAGKPRLKGAASGATRPETERSS